MDFNKSGSNSFLGAGYMDYLGEADMKLRRFKHLRSGISFTLSFIDTIGVRNISHASFFE